eukprot:9203846-Alexandrium_andersonii.AAC.1
MQRARAARVVHFQPRMLNSTGCSTAPGSGGDSAATVAPQLARLTAATADARPSRRARKHPRPTLRGPRATNAPAPEGQHSHQYYWWLSPRHIAQLWWPHLATADAAQCVRPRVALAPDMEPLQRAAQRRQVQCQLLRDVVEDCCARSEARERLQDALCVGHDAHCAPRAAAHPEHDRQEDG